MSPTNAYDLEFDTALGPARWLHDGYQSAGGVFVRGEFPYDPAAKRIFFETFRPLCHLTLARGAVLRSVCGVQPPGNNGDSQSPDEAVHRPVYYCPGCSAAAPGAAEHHAAAYRAEWEAKRAIVADLRARCAARVGQMSTRQVLNLARGLGLVEADPFFHVGSPGST